MITLKEFRSEWKRNSASTKTAKNVTEALQEALWDIIKLAMISKQAHWNVIGPNFETIHKQLDELYSSANDIADTVAERIVQLGKPAYGCPGCVDEKSKIASYPNDFVDCCKTVSLVADALSNTIDSVSKAREVAAENKDVASEDVAIQTLRTLEKSLWFMQATETIRKTDANSE